MYPLTEKHLLFYLWWFGIVFVPFGREDDLSTESQEQNYGGIGSGTSVPSPPQACLVFLSNGQECAGRGQPGRQPRAQAAPVTVPGWPFTPELSRLLLLSSKMFQYVELWGRDREKNRDIVEKEIMNKPAASLHTPHVGRSG